MIKPPLSIRSAVLRPKNLLRIPPVYCLLCRILHELMHASGFWHEQSRSDRDEYVDIILDNIEEGKDHNFDKQRQANMVGDYDFCSIMHYGLYAFSKNGRRTIVPKHNNFNCDIGDASTFSPMDIEKLNIYNGCNKDPKDPREVTSPGYPKNYANNLDSTVKVIEVQEYFCCLIYIEILYLHCRLTGRGWCHD